MTDPTNLIDRYDELCIARAVGDFEGVCVTGTLVRSPMKKALYKVELGHVPMVRPHEYANAAMYECPGAAPVLISPSQRYLILSSLVQGMRQHIPDLGPIGVRLYGPDFNVQLPRDLLAEDVMITHAPTQLVPSLMRAGRTNIAVVEHDVRADGLEQGYNNLTVWFLSTSPVAINGFLHFVESSTYLQALSGLTVFPVGAAELRMLDRKVCRAGAAPHEEGCNGQ